MPDIVLLAIGFLMLLVGGEVLVSSSAFIARRFGLSPLIIGLTIMAYGTSMPEMLVAIKASLSGYNDVVVGNIYGSNIVNSLLALGLAAIIFIIPFDKKDLRREIIILSGATLAYAMFGLFGMITRTIGLLFVGVIVAYTIWLFRKPPNNHDLIEGENSAETPEKDFKKTIVKAILTIVSLFALAYGSDLFVEGAVGLGKKFGLSEAVIGATIVAIGTSLPEIVTAIVAAYRKHTEMLVGNILGSNLFNILAIGGTAALITPTSISTRFITFDMPFLLLATFAPILVGYTTTRITRPIGLVFVGVYAIYLGLQF